MSRAFTITSYPFSVEHKGQTRKLCFAINGAVFDFIYLYTRVVLIVRLAHVAITIVQCCTAMGVCQVYHKGGANNNDLFTSKSAGHKHTYTHMYSTVTFSI